MLQPIYEVDGQLDGREQDYPGTAGDAEGEETVAIRSALQTVTPSVLSRGKDESVRITENSDVM
jgi:hypothetical protein